MKSMKTLWLTADDGGIETAAELIKKGGLVAIPTETVYGLAADALNGEAVSNIFKAKGRPMDNPLIVHIAALSQLEELVAAFPEKARALSSAYWPGPLTLVLPKSKEIPDEVSAGLSSVAVRFPSHPVAHEVILKSGCALAAPSANLSGSPSPTEARHVYDDLNGRIDAVLDGGGCEVGVESTVLSLTDESKPRLLRPGGVTLQQLESVIGPVVVDPAVLNRLEDGEKAASPGMKYKHYSPNAHVVLLKGGEQAYAAFVNAHAAPGVMALCYEEDVKNLLVEAVSFGRKDDDKTQARLLFRKLRELDEKHAKLVFAHCPKPVGVGMAVYNRLIRAAGFEVQKLD